MKQPIMKTIKQYWTNIKVWRDRCSQWMAVGNRANWCVFSAFALLIFAQTLIFDHFAFREFAVYTSVQNGSAMIFSKLAAALLFASLTFILKDKRWLLLLSVIIDAWMVANLIYMRNNHILLDAEAFNMSGNLHGYFWSVLIYVELQIDLIFFIMTGLFGCIFFFTKRSARSWKAWLIVIAVSIGLRHGAEGLFVNAQHKQHIKSEYKFMPFMRDFREPVYGIQFPLAVANTSVLYSPFYILTDYYLMINNIQPERPMNVQDSLVMSKLIPDMPADTLESPLIIVLLESLENWVVTPQIMPNLYRLTQNDHVFYANRIHTQIVGAPSADGQMIVNTGLLPINAGATCLHYPTNTFPGIMRLAPDSTLCLLPHDPKVWNQTQMSPAYGYDTTISYCDIDTILFQKLDSLVDDGYRYIQCITLSTHAPFWNEKYSYLELPSSMPWVMYNFIRGFNSLDDGLGYFIRKIECDSNLQNYTIVFTGDHRILHYEKRQQMKEYAEKWASDPSGYDWLGKLTPEDDCLPLIIYSPKISGNPRYTEDAYQMDIYPTYQSLLGSGNFYWKGFGINLMDPNKQNRLLKQENALLLSDKVIRNNYFKSVIP